ncbi:secondary thiamine-phosphate synthase enzyme [Halovenus aranensis]|jgi:secondary thiamine-phosphate synthase enzyme|uniref:Secondary thiamine-phosphate synthase enzyme n=1 Tax=Halovenus aranensis TaxID=890420 RepID=A0A1G8U5S1_9EURY|nr:secondary thiamine-phosphate synthase enzyme YjbQ [Halovenus aranensis]SDJ49083.1 secondary thiamine-phosphate synthase enzyme [Halovenus aranensis]
MERFDVQTDGHLDVIDVTERVSTAVPPSVTGTVTVFVQHTTAGVTVNEGEPRLLGDIESALSELVADSGWDHDSIDDNAPAHLRAMLVGPDVTLPVEDGALQLGTWQSVLFVECDGPRTRRVTVTVD